MIVRIASSQNCPICKSYLNRLDKLGFKYQVLDADDIENKEFLDQQHIFELPVVQILDSDGRLKWQFPHGEYSPRAINAKISSLGG